MKDIKVIFKGNKSPSGKRTNVEYMIGEKKLDQLKKTNLFDIEVLEKPKPKPKPKKKDKKEKE